MPKRLTQKQDTFCLKYFELGNATEAAKLAGYSPKTARFIAAQNLSKLNIQAKIAELRKIAQDATIANFIERQQVLTEIVRGRFADFLTKLTPDKLKSAALQEVKIAEYAKGENGESKVKTTTIKLHNPIQAIDVLNKMDKIYTERPAVNVDNRKIEIIVSSAKAKTLTQRLIEGERTE